MEAYPQPSTLRWRILRQALLRQSEDQSRSEIDRVSRRTALGFNLIPLQLIDLVPPSSNSEHSSREVCVFYTLPIDKSPKLKLTRRIDNSADLSDFEISNRYDIDNTGLVCQWPSEDVLAYFCISNADLFRSKRVIELGSGYGLAGFAIAAATDASEVIISDGNPQVVDYIQRNIDANSEIFGGTRVRAMTLHWNQKGIPDLSDGFEVIVASDCTFFKEFHKDLARVVKTLLKNEGPSEAIFFSPGRGDSLEKFLVQTKEIGLSYSITENYDTEVWKRHQQFMIGDNQWAGYEKDHCYPLLIRITH